MDSSPDAAKTLERIKKSGSNSKIIGIVFSCKIGHIWSFVK